MDRLIKSNFDWSVIQLGSSQPIEDDLALLVEQLRPLVSEGSSLF